MILYTPLGVEEVLANLQNNDPERSYITHGGRTFYVDKHASGECTLTQLVSTDPNDYLNVNYQPGTMLRDN